MSRRSSIPRLQEQILEVLRQRASTPALLCQELGCRRTSFYVAVSELERRLDVVGTGRGPNRVLQHPSLFPRLDLDPPEDCDDGEDDYASLVDSDEFDGEGELDAEGEVAEEVSPWVWVEQLEDQVDELGGELGLWRDRFTRLAAAVRLVRDDMSEAIERRVAPLLEA